MADKNHDTQAEDLRFDVRLVPHSIRRHFLGWEDVDKHLKGLPDEAEEAEQSVVVFTTPFSDRLDES